MNKSIIILLLIPMFVHCQVDSSITFRDSDIEILNVVVESYAATVTFIYKDDDFNINTVAIILNYKVIETFDRGNFPDVYKLRDLMPCTTYRVVVRANTSTEVFDTARSLTTDSVKLPPVENIQYNQSNGLLTWRRPTNGSTCISRYCIKYEERVEFVISESFWLAIGCSNVTIYIQPLGFHAIGGEIATQMIQRGLNLPTEPTSPRLLWRTPTSLKLESAYENELDLCSLETASFKCIDRFKATHIANVTLSPNQRKFNVIIQNLIDLTNYTCTVRIKNKNDSSNESSKSSFETEERLTDPPDFSTISIESKSLSIAWKAPNGKVRLKFYHVEIVKIGKNYDAPKNCITSKYNETFQVGADKLNYTILNLEPFTNYSIRMAIENTAGIGGYGIPMKIVTQPNTPYQVNNLRFDGLTLKWDLPCEINGKIIAIKGILYESQPPNVGGIYNKWKLKKSSDFIQVNYYKFDQIKPEHLYNITIWIEILTVENFTLPMNETFTVFSTLSKWGLINCNV